MANVESTIDALEKSGNVTLNGQMFQENADSLTIQVGGSLIDIPKRHILSRREVDARSGTPEESVRIVDVTIDRDAKLIQRVPVKASDISAVGGSVAIGGFQMSACACACECNCACDCACGDEAEMSQFLRTMAFRNPMIQRSVRR